MAPWRDQSEGMGSGPHRRTPPRGVEQDGMPSAHHGSLGLRRPPVAHLDWGEPWEPPNHRDQPSRESLRKRLASEEPDGDQAGCDGMSEPHPGVAPEHRTTGVIQGGQEDAAVVTDDGTGGHG